MATQTQLQFDPTLACRHEQICQAMYEWQRRRLQTLCEWLVPETEAARGLFRTVLIEVWRQAPEVWMAAGAECVARALAQHFRPLFAHLRPDVPTGALSLLATALAPAPGSDALRQAVLDLPLPWRLLYLFHDVEHYPAGTLAVWLDINRQHCGAMIHQARLHLRRRLTPAS